MDNQTFIVELIKPLAWPVTLLVILIMLRKPLTDLILLTQKLKFRDLEVEFGRKAEELAARATNELPAARVQLGAVAKPDKYLKLAESSPRAAVIEAWSEVERAARESARKHGLPIPLGATGSPSMLIRALQTKGILDKNKADLANGLRMFRNEAAHAPDFALGVDAALNYADVARRLVDHLSNE